MKLKKFENFITENISKYWIYDGNFEVSLDMITKGRFNQKLPDEVLGTFICSDLDLTTLEGCPSRVEGNFTCSHNQLTTLVGCPEKVGGSFSCSHNRLTSLRGCPEKVGGSFLCSDNQLTSLEGCPISIDGDFKCHHNFLTSLEGITQEGVRDLDCSCNDTLTSLEGSPNEIKEDLMFNNCKKLKTLYGAPKCDNVSSHNDTSIPEIEYIWFRKIRRHGYTNYYLELLQYIIEIDGVLRVANTIKWPDGFYNDELVKSLKSINKFKL